MARALLSVFVVFVSLLALPFGFVHAEWLPDLTVESPSFDPNDKTPTVVIKNLGPAPAEAYGVRMEIYWKSDTGTDLDVLYAQDIRRKPDGSYAPATITAGGSLEVKLRPPNGRALDQAKTLVAIINPDRSFAELHTDNNTREFPVPRPDLVVSKVDFTATTKSPIVHIKNEGTFKADLGTVETRVFVNLHLRWFGQGNQPLDEHIWPSIRHKSFGEQNFWPQFLLPGETIHVVLPDQPTSLAQGALRMTTDIDTNLKVGELNEHNGASWDIPGAIPPPPPPSGEAKPDLKVESIEIDQTTRRATIRIKNIGTATAFMGNSPATNVYVSYEWTDGTPRAIPAGSGIDPIAGTYGITEIAAGGLADLPIAEDPPPIAMVFFVHLDPTWKLETSAQTRGNNDGQVTLPAADLVIESVTFDQTTRKPTVTIKNKGGYPALLVRPGYSAQLSPMWWNRVNQPLYPLPPQYKLRDFYDSDVLPAEAMITIPVDHEPVKDATQLHLRIHPVAADREYGNDFKTVPIPFMPDLKIDSITFSDDLQRVPTIHVKNTGNYPAPVGTDPYSLQVVYEWRNNKNEIQEPSRYKKLSDTGISAVVPGQVVSIPTDYPPSNDMTAKLTTMIDVKLAVTESYEDNNTGERKPPLPDFHVKEVSFDAATGQPQLIIENRGVFDANFNNYRRDPVMLAYWWVDRQGYSRGSGIKRIEELSQRGHLLKGEMIRVTVPATYYENAMWFVADIDATDAIAEANEGDNERYKQAPQILPDLLIDQVNIVAQTVTVKNQSAVAVTLDDAPNETIGPKTVTFRHVWLDRQGQELQRSQVSVYSQYQRSLVLPPGETVTFPVGPIPEKAFLIDAFIDDTTKVTESNECNNEQIVGLIDESTTDSDMALQDAEATLRTLAHASECTAVTTVTPPDATPDVTPAVSVTPKPPEGVEPEASVSGKTPEAQVTIPPDISISPIEPPVVSIPPKGGSGGSGPAGPGGGSGGKPPIGKPVVGIPHIIKNGVRFWKVIVTRGKGNKLKLYGTFLNEKLIEVNGLLVEGKTDEAMKRLRSYEGDLVKAQGLLGDVLQRKEQGASGIIEVLLKDQLRHQVVLVSLESLSPQEQQEFIKMLKQKGLTMTKQGLDGLDDPALIDEIFSQGFDENGSLLRSLRNADILTDLETNVKPITQQIIQEEKQESLDAFKRTAILLPTNLRKTLLDQLVTPIIQNDKELTGFVDNMKKDFIINPVGPRGEADPLPSPSFPTEGFDWQSVFPPEALKELEESLGPMLEQIRALCGTVPRNEQEAQECAQKILGGVFTIPQEDSIAPETGPIVIPTIDEGMSE